MAETNIPPEIPIRDFGVSKQVKLFQTLKKPRFTGCLRLTDPLARQWEFFLYFGRIIYATGGVHPVRRWRRNLALHLPAIANDSVKLQQDLEQIGQAKIKLHWEYDLLKQWVDEGRATREQAGKMIEDIVSEVFFEISQTSQVTYSFEVQDSSMTQLAFLDSDQIILKSWKQLQAWQNLPIGHLSPDMVPKIRDRDNLKSRSSERTFSLLDNLLNGRRSFRDLSMQMKRNIVQVAMSLMPYIKLEFIELVWIDDLATPVKNVEPLVLPQTLETSGKVQRPLIALVDPDTVCQSEVQEIVTSMGCELLQITDPSKAIATLLAKKPALILLELELQKNNGLEICAQLKKLSLFRNTPVLILTGSNGIFDRVKSKLMGAADFIDKPIDPQDLSNYLKRYLKRD